MNREDCYFFVDMALPEEERVISVLCMECHDKEFPELGWFYKGSTEGYGPFNYECNHCQKMIHEGKKGDHATN